MKGFIVKSCRKELSYSIQCEFCRAVNRTLFSQQICEGIEEFEGIFNENISFHIIGFFLKIFFSLVDTFLMDVNSWFIRKNIPGAVGTRDFLFFPIILAQENATLFKKLEYLSSLSKAFLFGERKARRHPRSSLIALHYTCRLNFSRKILIISEAICVIVYFAPLTSAKIPSCRVSLSRLLYKSVN